MPHWCYVPRLANFSYEEQKQIAIPYDNDEDDYSTCEMYDINYDNLTDDMLRNLTTVVCKT